MVTECQAFAGAQGVGCTQIESPSMTVVEIGRFPRSDSRAFQHRSGLPTWYRARYLTGLVARSHLMIIDLEQGDRTMLARHLTRIAGLSREAGLDAIAAEAERLRELLTLSTVPDASRVFRRLHAGILALRAGDHHRSS